MSKSISWEPVKKNRELIFARKGSSWIGAVLQLDPGKMAAEDYGRLYEQFASQYRIRPVNVSLETLYPDQCHGQIYWTESVALGGCRFTLLVLPNATDAEVADLKAKLQRTRDVVSLTTIRIRLLVQFDYKL